MTKEVFSDLATLVNGVSAINGIVTEIEVAFDNTLSRDGSSPNQMAASLDMNSNRILNLPLPLANTEPARLIDIFNYLSFPDTGDRESLTFKKEGAPANQVYWRLSTGGNGEPGLDLLNDSFSATPVFTISRSGSTPTYVTWTTTQKFLAGFLLVGDVIYPGVGIDALANAQTAYTAAGDGGIMSYGAGVWTLSGTPTTVNGRETIITSKFGAEWASQTDFLRAFPEVTSNSGYLWRRSQHFTDWGTTSGGLEFT